MHEMGLAERDGSGPPQPCANRGLGVRIDADTVVFAVGQGANH
jgi:hypothetical protein